MALGTPATIGSVQGQAPGRPSFVQRMQFAGDDAYPTGGTLEFAETYLLAELGINATVQHVWGWGFTAGAITHMVSYDEATDALRVYVLATGAQAAPGDLSGVTIDCLVAYR